MKVSVDGLRRSATRSMNTLAETIEGILEELPDYLKDELIESYNDAAQYVGIFNCVYSDLIEDFNNLSNELEIKRLGEEKSEEDGQ